MSNFKPRKSKDPMNGNGKYYLLVMFPMWRNWIRRQIYSYISLYSKESTKHAYMGLYNKYKSNGRQLIKMQGQDY